MALGCTVVSTAALEVFGRDRAGLMRHRQAFLKQSRELVLAQALAPTRQRRALEAQLMAEHVLAAEELVVRILDPARAQRLVGARVHVLEDEQTGHPSRVGSGGWPGPALKPAPKRWSRKAQSICAASRTSG